MAGGPSLRVADSLLCVCVCVFLSPIQKFRLSSCYQDPFLAENPCLVYGRESHSLG